MTIDDMTDAQEAAIEALSLRDHGFAEAAPRILVRTDAGIHAIDEEGTVYTWTTQPSQQGFRSLMADVYGQGTTA